MSYFMTGSLIFHQSSINEYLLVYRNVTLSNLLFLVMTALEETEIPGQNVKYIFQGPAVRAQHYTLVYIES